MAQVQLSQSLKVLWEPTSPPPPPSLSSKPSGEELIYYLWSEALCGVKALGLYLMWCDILQKITSKEEIQGNRVRQKWSQNWWEGPWAGTQTQISVVDPRVPSVVTSLLPTRHPRCSDPPVTCSPAPVLFCSQYSIPGHLGVSLLQLLLHLYFIPVLEFSNAALTDYQQMLSLPFHII